MPIAGGPPRSRRGGASGGDNGHDTSEPSQFGERREVTALFYDLIDSTRLLARTDLEDYQDLIAAFQRRTAAAVLAQGGAVRETLGDGGIAFFGYPAPAEDTAVAAVHAGLNIVQAV